MAELYIGLMSGTSADGIDAALVDFNDDTPKLIATHYTPYSLSMREEIIALCKEGANEIERLGKLDIALGKAFANAVNNLLKQTSLEASDITAIGSHGQTIRHRPIEETRFTLQIGDPNTIAAETGITTIADFRRKDVALGGQGAPLVPGFHQMLFASNTTDRVIINIGGIANITLLPKDKLDTIIGFDTGPGNTLLDAWIAQHHQLTHDANGDWGKSGTISQHLLHTLLTDPYFKQQAPKSTGREYFNLPWLMQHLKQADIALSPADVQATLTELTARTILDAIKPHLSQGELLICGGGAHNQFLLARLQTLAQPNYTLATTTKYQIDPNWLEAIAFAWLAKQTLNRKPGNIPSVTGASKATILGGVYFS